MTREELRDNAVKHNAFIKSTYGFEISKSAVNTTIHYACKVETDSPTTDIELVDTDTVSAIMDNAGPGVAALNFASYKHPGGMFMSGSSAQEEALCHESDLFEILCKFENDYYAVNRQNLNFGLYTDTALYTPDVLFMRDDKQVKCDIITCASPNMFAVAYHPEKVPYNDAVMRERCHYVCRVAKAHDVHTLILGAWGCGVFRQSPTCVANSFKAALSLYHFDKVIFAVPKARDSVNYDTFRVVFG